MGAMLLPSLPSNVASVSAVRFYSREDHSGTDMVEIATVTDDDGAVTVDPGILSAGRWYPVLVGEDTGGAEVTYTPATLTYVDLPTDDTLVMSPEALAVEAGMALPLSAAQRQTITGALRDAHADVYAYLGREILPTVKVETGRWPYETGWDLEGTGDDPLIRVLSVEAELSPYPPHEATGMFTVTYLAGIDCRLPEYSPILRYLIAHALNGETFRKMWATSTKAKGEVKSVSAEGQSVTFERPTLGRTDAGKPGDLLPGSLPAASSMDRWRVRGRRAYQAESRVTDWPFYGVRW